jgi:hypothetical protein
MKNKFQLLKCIVEFADERMLDGVEHPLAAGT